ncbi:MAG: hypothetical protein LAQ69_49905 [Acidobacteriia bacterium]|nr:hypothetical protein [Terriglobia bacterium]
MKKDRDAAGLSGEKDACSPKVPCKKKKWIAFHVLDVTDAKKDAKKIKPLKGTRISTKLPGPGDTDVISADKPVRVNNLDDGTASITQVQPPEEHGWLFDTLETT